MAAEERQSISYRRESYLEVDWGTAKDLPRPLVILPELPTDLSSPAARVAKLDEHAAAVRAHLAVIYSQRNDYIPIAQLPDETLADIFLWVARSFPLDSPAFRDWTSLMLVCRRWRSVAVSSSALWSRVYIGHDVPSFSSLLRIDRCKMHPLTVNMNVDATYFQTDARILRSALSVIGPHFDNVETLEAKATHMSIRKLVYMLAEKKRRNLRHLSLALADTHYWEEPEWFDLHPDTAANLFSHLTSISLSNVGLGWDHFHNLTRIHIMYTVVLHVHYLKFPTLEALLRRSPALSDLLLWDCFLIDDIHASSAPIRLPCLSRCSLRSHPAHCAFLLSAMQIPPATTIAVSTHGEVAHVGEVMPLLDVLRKHFERPGAPLLRALQLQHHTPAWRWYSNPMLQYDGEEGHEPSLSLEILMKGPSARLDIAAEILQPVLTKNVVALDWSQNTRQHYSNGLGGAFQYNVLRALPALRDVFVCSTPHNFSWISKVREMVEDTPEKLQEEPMRRLEGVYWVESARSSELSKNAMEKFTGSLRQMVDVYARVGHPLKRLVFDPNWLTWHGKAYFLDDLELYESNMRKFKGDGEDLELCEMQLRY
ncbi:uncharacterized protein SCHCODRAFT_02621216 [Schizophyllum commune H4-8]|uniref:uncharacterized protein n=1 Tax=Schizophyllum commune (strain H4-8 / FGSC 9210) TaxID=578458 RepID=UPI00215FC509|nr:uncharacterized protein SCHCODRAFT_02621216 [Schizophyllum commune H4-8]KAI5893236.1 hypothetical protein SCHCODRAFT_02621216 [Schizophyllum commune H4-8]